jgi:hypothetical protein
MGLLDINKRKQVSYLKTTPLKSGRIRLAFPVPLDRCKINTELALNQLFFGDDTTAENSFKEAGHEWYAINGKSTKYDSGYKQSVRINLMSYSGITLICHKKGTGWTLQSIEFNPVGILYGHTGRTIEIWDFTRSLAILRSQIAPLLFDPSEAWKLIPGTKGPGTNSSYWSSIEIPLNFHDQDGSKWAALSNTKYPRISKGIRYDGETITIGKSRSKLTICLYRRDLKMKETLKKLKKEPGNTNLEMKSPGSVLRLEIKLRDSKLIEFLGHRQDNTAHINGKSRLVRFHRLDLLEAFFKVVYQLEGVRKMKDLTAETNDKHSNGRMLGIIAAIYNIPIDELLSIYSKRFKSSSVTNKRLRDAAYHEHETYANCSLEQTFTEASFECQPRFKIKKLERRFSMLRDMTDATADILEAYVR